MMTTSASVSEFPRPIAVETAMAVPVGKELTAARDELAAIAERLGVISVGGLNATVTLSCSSDGRTAFLRGECRARMTRSCVVTLEPFEEEVVAPIDVMFFRDEDLAAAAELDADPATDTVVEVFDGHLIDAGEQTLQCLLVALDPYPRAPGAELPAETAPEADGSVNPFAALAGLRGRPEGSNI